MKRQLSLGLAVVLLLVALPVSASGGSSITKDYGSVTLYNWGKGNFTDLWDLTQCDLTLTYTINMSGIANPGWSLTEVGLHEVGAPNMDPNYQGGWMLSRYAYNLNDENKRDNDDYHVLMKHGWLEEYYDVVPPQTFIDPMTVWQYINHGFWFDRDGVDPWQQTYWGYIYGVTYSTGGVYDIVIAYHAIDEATGTMFATVNGEQQGFYLNGWKNAPPEKIPVGRSFVGDLAQMQVFYGRGAGGGTVTLSSITVTGCPYTIDVAIDVKPGSDPNSINLKSKGVVPVAVLTTEGFDARSVDPTSVLFADADPVRWALEDVDGDGDMDLVLHFKTQELELGVASIEATLTGSTYAGQDIQGMDSVRIVPGSK